MPSRTRRRNYRGGGPLETCQAYLKKNNLGENVDKCPKIIENVTFTPGGMFSSSKAKFNDGGSPFDYTRWADKYDPETIERNKQAAAAQAAADASAAAKSQAEAAAKLAAIPPCNGYDNKNDRYIYKNPKTLQIGQCNSTNKLNDCTKWSSTKDGRGNPKDWFVTDDNGQMCKIKDELVSPEGTNLYETIGRTDYARLHPNDPAPLFRRAKTEYGGIPISYASPSDAYDWILNPIPDTKRGGRRSRRKSRKSRR
jgi:hypothetical protein